MCLWLSLCLLYADPRCFSHVKKLIMSSSCFTSSTISLSFAFHPCHKSSSSSSTGISRMKGVYGHMVEQTIQNQKQQLADILEHINLIKSWGPIHRVTRSA
ncbi:hypothetical protein PILCRDRAFT_700993 [Piloderma croceum F 1598]|uniref:Uncharacterized protein n=1 Tax=Piloderma croceum (strain F 1598) TaxID=765440 RepID=A0A0C3F3K7_PILCF|nr:hypothetical protein PILCRDRAFT_700993 [Piloderma croceum F 1598]